MYLCLLSSHVCKQYGKKIAVMTQGFKRQALNGSRRCSVHFAVDSHGFTLHSLCFTSSWNNSFPFMYTSSHTFPTKPAANYKPPTIITFAQVLKFRSHDLETIFLTKFSRRHFHFCGGMTDTRLKTTHRLKLDFYPFAQRVVPFAPEWTWSECDWQNKIDRTQQRATFLSHRRHNSATDPQDFLTPPQPPELCLIDDKQIVLQTEK